MQPELGPVQQSFLSWILTALGFKYALLLPVSALVGFVPTLIVVVSGKGPMAGVALSLAIALGRRVVAHARDLGAVSEQWLTLHREAPSHGSR